MRAEIGVSGIVQGVGFRPFVYRIATENKLMGFVRNRGDAHVEIIVEGTKGNIEDFLRDLQEKRPPLARIFHVDAKYVEEKNEFSGFEILKSSSESELAGSVIPPDVSVCDKCLSELRDPSNTRHNYFFITCTDCGPRYTIIQNLPYDRSNTTMKEFQMCSICEEEYLSPSNRRFHSQTVACSKCGPKVYLATNKGNSVDTDDPIAEAGKLLEEGNILAVKGYGGFHVASATTRDETIIRLRAVKHRAQKPFAIMSRNLETVRSFAEISQKEAELLTSYIKPIVLLNKSDNYYLSDLVAPGLHNVGVMLPYTGLHHMLFDGVREPAFVMTSANPSNEPIVIDNAEAIEKLGDFVDYFLFHTRSIAQRCDDSVIRVHGQEASFIRRSRGYAPEPVQLKQDSKFVALGVGAELNATSCVLLKDKAFLSQHIGDVENLETLQFLRNATRQVLRLTNTSPEVIGCDLHPKFTTTIVARDYEQEYNCPLVEVQHHHAHGVTLMVEHGLDEIVAVVCDGYGYGSDGKAWGGEVLHCTKETGFERVAHLEEHPLVGGDLATRYPLRMAAGILRDSADVKEWLLSHSSRLPHGKEEVELILQKLSHSSVVKTTSCGRVFDAVSAVLGTCYERTYEGEPAMKLESAAIKGRDVLRLEPVIESRTLNTAYLVQEVFKNRNNYSVYDLAFSAQEYLARGLATLAVDEARRLGVDAVGFSGGVASNEHVTRTLSRLIVENGLRFVVHEQVPPGDGGVSLGQAVAAAWQMER